MMITMMMIIISHTIGILCLLFLEDLRNEINERLEKQERRIRELIRRTEVMSQQLSDWQLVALAVREQQTRLIGEGSRRSSSDDDLKRVEKQNMAILGIFALLFFLLVIRALIL